MRGLFVLTALATAQSAVDCSTYMPYTDGLNGNPSGSRGWKVYKDGKAYSASGWIGATDIPGADVGDAWSPWTLDGDCQPGTMGSGDSGLDQIDCSTYLPWDSTTHGNPPGQKWQVYKDSKAYTAEGWVETTDVPGGAGSSWSPWTLKGKCIDGTMGSGTDGPGTEDCSQIHAWSPFMTYATEGEKVYADHVAYSCNYWNEGDKPAMGSDTWKYIGKCKENTDTLGPAEDVILPPQWKLDLTCSCCDNCGTIVNGQVYCKDVPQEKCYYKWCGDAGKKNDDDCKDAKNHQKFAWWDGQMPKAPVSWPAQVYAPYFDSGLYGWPPLMELYQKHGVGHFVVAFIVSTSEPSQKTGKCQGAYAGAIPVESGPTYEKEGKFSHLYDELAKLRDAGGDFIVSFGGANGIELADSEECQNGDAVANLKAEYGRILDLLNTNKIDFDIEGNAYSSINKDKGWKFRFEAIKALKAERPDLFVIWTLPILPTGLTPDGIAFFELMMNMDAPFNLVNVMNMDYGECPTICDNAHIDECERSAMDNLTKQLYDTAASLGKATHYGWSSADDLWKMVGSTPMLGLNDVTCLTYTLDAARTNLAHWKEKKIAMLSNWSIARDHPCPSSNTVSVDCSSYEGQTQDYQFLELFSAYGK